MRPWPAALLALAATLPTSSAGADPLIDPVVAAAMGYVHMVERLYRRDQSSPVPAKRVRPRTPAPGLPFAPEICAAAERHGIRPAFLFAVVATESAFNPSATSRKGARGLAQVMPATGLEVGIAPQYLWHPAANAEAAARYLRILGDRYDNDMRRVLAAYNAGPAVGDGQKPMPPETRAYVPRVSAVYRRLLAVERREGSLCRT